jgi:hypothetical protein
MHQPLPVSEQGGREVTITNYLKPELERYLEENKLKILIKLGLEM